MKHLIEIPFSIDHVPYCCLAMGSDLEEVLADAQYCVDSPDPTKFLSIDNLPASHYDTVVEAITEEVRTREEMRAEALQG